MIGSLQPPKFRNSVEYKKTFFIFIFFMFSAVCSTIRASPHATFTTLFDKIANVCEIDKVFAWLNSGPNNTSSALPAWSNVVCQTAQSLLLFSSVYLGTHKGCHFLKSDWLHTMLDPIDNGAETIAWRLLCHELGKVESLLRSLDIITDDMPFVEADCSRHLPAVMRRFENGDHARFFANRRHELSFEQVLHGESTNDTIIKYLQGSRFTPEERILDFVEAMFTMLTREAGTHFDTVPSMTHQTLATVDLVGRHIFLTQAAHYTDVYKMYFSARAKCISDLGDPILGRLAALCRVNGPGKLANILCTATDILRMPAFGGRIVESALLPDSSLMFLNGSAAFSHALISGEPGFLSFLSILTYLLGSKWRLNLGAFSGALDMSYMASHEVMSHDMVRIIGESPKYRIVPNTLKGSPHTHP